MRFPSSMATLASAILLPLATQAAYCPGSIDFGGYGPVQLVPHGWFNHSKAFKPVDVVSGAIVPRMGSRSYFASNCTAGTYDRHQYLALHLLGRTLSYSVDLSGASCGCNAALYLASMAQNPEPSRGGDFYCDANKVSGVACTEIDIQEANRFAWHSTIHGAKDRNGKVGGFGGYGGRHWSSGQYGPGGRCVDTERPFQVSVSFPVNSEGSLVAVETILTQEGRSCPLKIRLSDYEHLAELSSALAAGMTLVMSYWGAENMLWLDGEGNSNGTCKKDNKKLCSDTVEFSGFSVADLPEPPLPPQQQVPLDPWLEQVRAQQAAEAQLEQQQVADEQARQEANLESELRVQEAKATAVVVPTLAPLSERESDHDSNLVSELFKNVFGGFVRRYEVRARLEAHATHLNFFFASFLGLLLASSALLAAFFVARRRSRRASVYNPLDAAGRTLMLEDLVNP